MVLVDLQIVKGLLDFLGLLLTLHDTEECVK